MKSCLKHIIFLVLVCLLWSPVTIAAEEDNDSPNDYERDETGENEVEIRPEYDESNENNYLADQDVQHCKVSKDCQEYPFIVCEHRICVHKGIFPIYFNEFAGIIIMTFLLALANVGGIGGGGLIIPVTMALFTFTTKEAIALSGFTIFTGSVARFLYSWH